MISYVIKAYSQYGLLLVELYNLLIQFNNFDTK